MTQTNTPQYKRLAHQLRGHIRDGALKPGDRLPSWAEMQRTYGVNKYTIERAQKELAAEGLLVCRQGSGTFVAQPAPDKAVRKGIIGLCGKAFSYPADSSPYWTRLIAGIQSAARAAGYHILLLDDESRAGWEKADGLLLSTQGFEKIDYRLPLEQPHVLLMSPVAGRCHVSCDDADGTRQAVQHLLQLGHRRIGYFHGVPGPEVNQRIHGYHSAMKEAGIRVPQTWMREMRGLPEYTYQFDYGARFVETGRDNMHQWLRAGWAKTGCTAMLAHNDEFALGMMEAFGEDGLRVPEDVSIVGFDNNAAAAHGSPALTTIDVPLEEIGQKCIELMLQQIETDTIGHKFHHLPVVLRPGGTTRFIKENLV